MAKAEEPIIGIDLGTMYSCVGVWKDNRVQIIVNEHGERITPSSVAFTDTGRLTGVAEDNVGKNAVNTIFNAKQLIGRKFSDLCKQGDMKHWQFKVIPGAPEKPMVSVTYKGEEKQFHAEEISSMVLIKMKEMAEKYLVATVKNAVITVPAYYNNSQRQAIRDAGTIAGLKVMQTIAEPTAAAIAYAFNKKLAGINSSAGVENVLIFDLGAGNCNVSILTMKKGILKVKATCGASHLGGEDFVNRMVNHFVEEFGRINKKDITGNAKSMRLLRSACERAKRTLSSNAMAKIEEDYLYDKTDFYSSITRKDFNKLNMDLFKSCLELVKSCLRDAAIDKTQIHQVVPIGGSTRIPKVRQLLEEFFDKKEFYKSINTDEAVAYGATVQGAVLSGKDNEMFKLLQNTTPLSLGIETNGEMSVIIPRNHVIPTLRRKGFPTTVDNRLCVSINVFEGEHKLTENNKLLRKYVFSGIPSAPSGVSEYFVCFKIDANGSLDVYVETKNSLKLEEIKVTNYEEIFSKKELDKLVRKAEKYKADNEEMKKKIEARNSVESYFGIVKNIITDEKLSSKHGEANKEKMKEAIEVANLWQNKNQYVKLETMEEIVMELKGLGIR